MRWKANERFPAQNLLFHRRSAYGGQPTIVQNVETLYNLPHIVNHGSDWYHRLSRSQDGGTKIYGISGRVTNPGWWELPLGTTARELLERYAGGMADGVRFRGLLPGGISTAFMTEEHLDLPMDFSSIPPEVGRLGTATMIVLDDHTCPVGFVLNLEKFFARESCGWCTPCREGLPWVARILMSFEEGRATSDDLSLLEMHTKWLAPGHTFCGLAPGAMAPLQSALKYFHDDFERHITSEDVPGARSRHNTGCWSRPMATIIVDNKSYTVDERQNLLAACLGHGLNVPYFCWHPAMGSVGACRQCAVKQFKDDRDQSGRLVMSCMTPATNGTRISIDDPEAKAFRASVIEWLMVNHPHDCPVCDEGGECHLQDMTVMTGHVYRRYRFPKRTHRNQSLGPFIRHEMNRCIQCYRCVRFYRDYAGGRDLNVFGSHDALYFGREQDGTLGE